MDLWLEHFYKDEKNTRIIILEMNFPYELMIIFPKNSNPQKLDELEEIAKSFRIIPVSERIVYSYEIINDPPDMPAMFIAVPENWKLSGSAIKSGNSILVCSLSFNFPLWNIFKNG
jgi:hypothetical protein